MSNQVDQRAAILGSIRSALGVQKASEAIAEEYASIVRTYSRSIEADKHGMSDLFVDRLREYDAGVYCAADDLISSVISEVLTARNKKRLAIPAGLPARWLPLGFVFEEANGFDAYQLDATQGVLTGCTVAIAETGTIVLQNADAQGPRKLSLVPDYHLCVVSTGQIVATVPEAFERLQATSTLPTTFISGPSATADIEMTRIKGVHGPRFLDVVIVEG